MADLVLVFLFIPVKDTKIGVGGCLIDVPVDTRGTEDTVNDAGLNRNIIGNNSDPNTGMTGR